MEITDFSMLKDGETGVAPIELFKDFSLGNKRRKRSKNSAKKLLASIKKQGIIQPVLVRPHPKNTSELELLAGYGRRDLSKLAGLAELPFLLRHKSDEDAFICHLEENLNREDLNTVDKSIAAQEYMSLYEGDAEAVASKLNLSVKQVRELIELTKCCESVLDAIVDEDITASHAIILAPFGEKKQQATLKLIIKEKWTVKYLRERASKAQVPLIAAKFDTEACKNCNFNTELQVGLFDNVDTKAKCSNNTCYQDKTKSFLELEKVKALERYGNVLYLSESSEADRNTINQKALGQEQLSECKTCKSCVAILSDVFGSEGMLTPNQCVDKVCFSKAQQAFTQPIGKADKLKAGTKKDSKKINTVNAKTPRAVIERHNVLLREAAALHFHDDIHFQRCVIFSTTISQSGFKYENCISTRFEDVLKHSYSTLTAEQITQFTKEAIEYLVTTTETINCHQVTSTMINMLKLEKEKSLTTITQYWKPTVENLKPFTIEQINDLAQESGFYEHVEANKNANYQKLVSSGKEKLIKSFSDSVSAVDYTNFAPKQYLSIIA